MKKLLLVLAAVLVAAWVSGAVLRAAETQARQPRLFHVVSLKFKAEATKEQIKQVEEAFVALRQKIPEVASVRWGTNVSPEKLDKGFTHTFILTFRTDKDRDAYLVHPDHKEFGKLLGPVLADVFVMDFWPKN